MAKGLGKPHLRILAIDDGPFTRRHRTAPIAAVVVSLPGYVELVLADRVTVDGTDATDRVLSLVAGKAFLEGVHAVLLDGIAMGGFNLVDIVRLHRSLGRPVVTVTRRRPDFDAIRAALLKYFPRDARRRLRLLQRRRLFPVRTGGAPVYASAVGCTRREAAALLERTRVRGFWPEPLRLAHLVARAVAASAPKGGRA